MRLLLIMLVLGCSAVRVSFADPMTLREAYELAVAQSEQLKITDAELRSAEAQYRQAAGGMWPEVRAEGLGNFRDGEDPGEGTVDEYRAGVGATWTLFQGFRTLRSAEARKAEGESVVFAQARYRELLYQDVADVFYLVLAYTRELALLDETIAAFDERIKELEHRVSLGRSRKADLLASRSQAADFRLDAAQIRGLRDVSLEMLAFLTGRPAAEIEPMSDDPLPSADAAARAAEAKGERSDILAAERSAEAARLDMTAESGSRNVTVQADGNLYVWQDPDDNGDWDVVIRAELPLFDGGTRRADVAEKAADYEIRELQLAQLRRVSDREVRMTARQFESLLGQWAALQDALREATENVATQRSDYELGRSGNLDVLAALVQQYGLQRREVSLNMQLRAALVRVQVAAGGNLP